MGVCLQSGFVAVFVLIASSPRLLHAGEVPAVVPVVPVRPEPVPTAPRWSGGYTLALDGSALALAAVAVATENEATGVLSAATYLLGGPIVHALNADGRVWQSVALRLGLPLLGAALGAGIGYQYRDSCFETDDLCPKVEMAILGGIGAGSGILAASLIDGFVLGSAREAKPTTTWTPTVAPSQGGMQLGFAGTF